jgi:hypothetical protein
MFQDCTFWRLLVGFSIIAHFCGCKNWDGLSNVRSNKRSVRQAQGAGILRIRGLAQGVEPRQPIILRMPSPKGITTRKAQLLNILNLKSSSSKQRNFHGNKVPSEYTVKMTAVLWAWVLLRICAFKEGLSYRSCQDYRPGKRIPKRSMD